MKTLTLDELINLLSEPLSENLKEPVIIQATRLLAARNAEQFRQIIREVADEVTKSMPTMEEILGEFDKDFPGASKHLTPDQIQRAAEYRQKLIDILKNLTFTEREAAYQIEEWEYKKAKIPFDQHHHTNPEDRH